MRRRMMAQARRLRDCGWLPGRQFAPSLLLAATLFGVATSPAAAVPTSAAPPPGPQIPVGTNPPASTSEFKVNLLALRASNAPAASSAAAMPSLLATGSLSTAAPNGLTSQQPPAGALAADWSVWSSLRGGAYKDDGRTPGVTGAFAQATAGLGLHLTESAEFGIVLTGERVTQDEDGTASHVRGSSIALGPYLSMSFADVLTFQARAQWGWSDEDISQDVSGSVFRGDGDGERLLTEAQVSMEHDMGALHLVPDLSVFYGRDRHDSHTLSDGATVMPVAGHDETLGRASAGLTLSHAIETARGTLSPFLAGRIAWDFKQPDPKADPFRATLSAGLTYISGDVSASASVEWDGIATDGLESVAAKLALTRSF